MNHFGEEAKNAETYLREVLPNHSHIEHLYSGGQCHVFSADGIDNPVVIKVIRDDTTIDSRGAIETFERQRAILDLQKLRNEYPLNSAKIYEMYSRDDPAHIFPFLVQEYIEGDSIQTHIEKGTFFSTEDIVGIGLNVANALQWYHPKGYILRDINASGILLRPTNEGYRGVIVDTNSLTRPNLYVDSPTNSVTGPIGYFGPEEFNGMPGYTTDLRRLGLVLMMMYTGMELDRLRPTVNYSEHEDMRIFRFDYKPFTEHRNSDELSKGLESVIDALIDPNPSKRRYQDAKSVVDALNGVRDKRSLVSDDNLRGEKNQLPQPYQEQPVVPDWVDMSRAVDFIGKQSVFCYDSDKRVVTEIQVLGRSPAGEFRVDMQLYRLKPEVDYMRFIRFKDSYPDYLHNDSFFLNDYIYAFFSGVAGLFTGGGWYSSINIRA